MSTPSAKHVLAEAFRVAEQAGIRLGVTVYDDQLHSPWISSKQMTKNVRSKIDYVHFYLHYRESVREYSADLRRLNRLFPNAAIIGGAYAYDRVDYLPCGRGSQAPCSLDNDYRLFLEAFEEQVRLLDSGSLAAIEFYPAQFGSEDQWPGWSNKRACEANRRDECIRQTKRMRKAVVAVLNAEQRTTKPVSRGARIAN